MNSLPIQLQFTVCLLMLPVSFSCWAQEASSDEERSNGKHLFILSGQSNMAGHRPDEAFTPTVEKTFGKDNVIVVQDAQGGQPIHRWYRDWKNPDGETPKNTGDLYDRLMEKVQAAIKDQELTSITFCWMQGERDAKMQWSGAYKSSLLGLHQQLCKDLHRTDVAFIIGRLSDYDMENRRYPDWTKIREIQVSVAESNPRFAWIDTDDLNDGKNRSGKAISNDLHYSAKGYQEFGKRMAEAAIRFLQK